MFDEDAKLNLLVGKRCNNRCVFCLDRSGEPEDGTGETVVESVEDAVRALERDRAAGGTAVAYGRLEAALDKDFLAIVRAAKGLGYETQHLTSNGRVLGNRKFLETLVAEGVNQFTISLHAPEAGIHDQLSGRPRAFAQSVEGIENVVALRRERPIVLAFGVTVTALNLPLLTEHYAFLQSFTPRLIGLNALLYSGRALDHVTELSFPYAALEAELLRLLETHRDRIRTRFAVLGVPFCALAKMPPEVVGLREAFRMPASASSDGAFGHGGGDAAAADAAGWVETGAAGESGFGMRHLPVCERCSMRPFCPGVSAGYLALHGDGDFAALPGDYRYRAETDASLFPAGHFRYPVSDPKQLPERVHVLARALARAAAPDWRLAGISAVAHESQAEHLLRARFTLGATDARHELVLEVAPREEGGNYFRRTRRWGVTLDDDEGTVLDDATAQSRERFIGRLVKVLTRLDDIA